MNTFLLWTYVVSVVCVGLTYTAKPNVWRVATQASLGSFNATRAKQGMAPAGATLTLVINAVGACVALVMLLVPVVNTLLLLFAIRSAIKKIGNPKDQ